FFNFQNKISLG
ncbi:hypothetical protein, partial [Plasmodium yoelii yoelii]